MGFGQEMIFELSLKGNTETTVSGMLNYRNTGVFPYERGRIKKRGYYGTKKPTSIKNGQKKASASEKE